MQDYDPRSEKEPGIKGEMPRSRETSSNKVSRSSESDVIIDRPAQPLCNVRRVKVSGHVTSALRRLCGRSQHRRRASARRQKHRTQPNCNSDSASEPCSVVAVHSSIISPTSIRLVLSFTTPTISRLSQ